MHNEAMKAADRGRAHEATGRVIGASYSICARCRVDMGGGAEEDMPSMQPRTVIAAIFVALVSFACSETATNFFKTTPTFMPTAEQNYQKGLKELKAGSWQMASQYFRHVRSTFGFSKWATLSELGLADCDFGADKFTEAIDEYKNFIKAHPGNDRVQDGYAAFKIGQAYFKEIPSDWFVVPPSYEKDQGPVNDALRELSAFVEQYGDSTYAPEARKMIGNCVKRLTDHELYVARFYLDQNHPYAAIGRLEGIVQKYPYSEREPEIMLLLGKTYLKMNKPIEARATFVKLASQHADDYRAEKAKLYIQFIDKRYAGKI
jgi:outer membrane protein assembly factor BamD